MKKLEGYRIKGHKGTWYCIGIETFAFRGYLEQLNLMEHETYGEDAPHIIIDLDGKIVLEDVSNGF